MAQRRGVRKIDNVRWTSFFNFSTALAVGSVGLNLKAVATVPETLLRIRGEFCAWIDGASAPAKALRLSAGIVVVPQGTAASVLWDPNADSNAPWLWYTTFLLGYEEMVTDVIDVPVISAKRVEIDNKAMRRVRPDEEIQLVVTNNTIAGAGAVNIVMSARVLFGS